MNATFILRAMRSNNLFRTRWQSSNIPLIYEPRRINTTDILLASTTSSIVSSAQQSVKLLPLSISDTNKSSHGIDVK